MRYLNVLHCRVELVFTFFQIHLPCFMLDVFLFPTKKFSAMLLSYMCTLRSQSIPIVLPNIYDNMLINMLRIFATRASSIPIMLQILNDIRLEDFGGRVVRPH